MSKGFVQDEIDEIVSCLEDDAADFHQENDEDERATNMVQAAQLIRQLAEQRAELLALAEETREWHRGDKWRDSDIPMQREAWESRRDKIDRAIANATQQRSATGGEG